MESNVAPLPYRADGRRQPRTHLFVTASLVAGTTVIPVRIRNMSTTGALIEFSGAAAGVGERMVLRRGVLAVSGSIAWVESGRAGLAFDDTVDVAEWMARIGSVGQSKIDAMIADIRSGPVRSSQVAATPGPDDLVRQLVEIKGQLSRLADSLLEDDELILHHPEIQIFDITLQKIDRLIRDHSS